MLNLNILLKGICDSNHSNCMKLANKIQSLHNNKTLDSKTFTDYLDFLANSAECYTLTSNRNIVSNLISKLIPTTHDICMIVDIFRDITSTEGIKILQKLIDRKVEINADVLYYVLKSECISTLTQTRDFLLKHVQLDTKCLEELCLYGYFECIMGICNQKVKATTKTLENLLTYYSGSKYRNANYSTEAIMNYMTILFRYGANADLNCLKITCKMRHIKIIEKILSFKIIPDKECFNILVKETYPKDEKIVASIIDMLINSGYTLTLDDVTKALKNGYYVNNIHRFNFTFDDKFSEICYKTNYFPYKDIELKPTMECLRAECRKARNIKRLKELVGKGLNPDLECLRDACKIPGNFTNINYLVTECNIKPDIECIKNVAKSLRNPSLELLFTEYDMSDDSDD